jgi:hypothetical protein
VRRILHVDGAGVELEVAVGPLPVGYDAVHDAARVALEVARLRRLPHHPEHQLPVDEVRFDRADPREAVTSDGSEEAELPCAETLLAESCKLRAGASELVPAHRPEASWVSTQGELARVS